MNTDPSSDMKLRELQAEINPLSQQLDVTPMTVAGAGTAGLRHLAVCNI